MALLTYTKKASIALPCEPSLPYEVLTDYDTYCEWMPYVVKSKLLAKEGDLAIAEFEMSHPHKATFALECIHTKNKRVLTRRISGQLPIHQLEWIIKPGGEKQCEVTLTIQALANWHRLIPAYRGFMNASKCLGALQSQISCFCPEIAVPAGEGERIIELTETEQGLVCWIKGKKYFLTPAPEGK